MLCCYVQYVEIYTEQRAFATSINFFFSFEKKLLLNHTDYFEKIIVNKLHRKTTVNDGFSVSKVMTSTQDEKEDEEHGKLPKNSKMWNYKHHWTNMIRKHKNNSRSNRPLVKKLLPIGYQRWERFKFPIDGYHMS